PPGLAVARRRRDLRSRRRLEADGLVARRAARDRPAGAELVDPVELALQLAPAGAGEVVPAAADRVEAAAHLVQGVGELAPLGLEAGQAAEDLVGCALPAGLRWPPAGHRPRPQHTGRGAQDP